jgi:hypothetical protein
MKLYELLISSKKYSLLRRSSWEIKESFLILPINRYQNLYILTLAEELMIYNPTLDDLVADDWEIYK